MQTLQTGEKIVRKDAGAFLHSEWMKRAPEMTNDWGLKQTETERERGNVFIRKYMWMAERSTAAFAEAECRDMNACLCVQWIQQTNSSECISSISPHMKTDAH